MVRTRMAPSPTGKLHIGTAHTTLFNFLLAKKSQGSFVLRMDDTDPVRSTLEFEQDIMDHLKWLGLQWDEGPDIGGPHTPYRQSERSEIYKKYIDQLLESSHAYRCFCTTEELEDEKRQSRERKEAVHKYSGKCRGLSSEMIEKNLQEHKPFTIRMRTDFVDEVVIDDQIRGEIKIKGNEIGDFIIVRSDGSPILLLTTGIDDMEMEISHAIRGEDMLNVAFRMFYIFKALGKEMPKYAHKPFMYAQDGSKLSKRHGATSVEEFKQQGYLPEAMLNYLFFVGYTPEDDEKPFYALEEMIHDFDFSHFQKGMPKFDYKKLLWYNGQYIKKLTDEELADKLKPFVPEIVSDDLLKNLAPLVKERLNLLSEIQSLAGFLFSEEIEIPATGWKPEAVEQLEFVLKVLETNTELDFEKLNQQFMAEIEKRQWKVGNFFMNLRLALAGKGITPPITESMVLLGQGKCKERLEKAIALLMKVASE